VREFHFPEDVVETLREERMNHPNPAVRRKLDVLFLKSQGIAHVEIVRLTGLSKRTVERYLDQYLRDGLEGLTTIRRHCPTSKLMDHLELLRNHFLDHPPATVAQAQADIERLTGLRRGQTQVRAFLKNISVSTGARSVRCRRKPTATSSKRFWIGS
jgi:transposase